MARNNLIMPYLVNRIRFGLLNIVKYNVLNQFLFFLLNIYLNIFNSLILDPLFAGFFGIRL